MSGLGFDNGFPRVISAKTHSVIDYIHAGTNILFGVLFSRRGDTRAAKAAYILGAAVLGNALMTDYPLGVFRLWDFRVHGALDYGVAAASAAFPVLLDLDDELAKNFFYGQGAAETLTAGLTDYTDDSGARRRHRRYDERYLRYFSNRAA